MPRSIIIIFLPISYFAYVNFLPCLHQLVQNKTNVNDPLRPKFEGRRTILMGRTALLK